MNDRILALIEQAVRAPSSHNTQPWLFRVRDEAVELYADRSRALQVNDPHDRELTISCGAALFNLEVAAAREGVGTQTTLLPGPGGVDHLATVSLGSEPNAAIGALADAIPARRSTREKFEDHSLPDGLASELLALAERHEGCHVILVDTTALREEVASLVAEGDEAQFGNVEWRRELAHWLHPPGARDGLPAPKLAGPVVRATIRHLDLGGFVAGADKDLAREAPLLLVLSSDLDEPRAWIETGRLLEHASLHAALSDIQVGYINQPCQVAHLRPKLREILGIAGHPQLILRFGHAPETDNMKPRRAVEDVLIH